MALRYLLGLLLSLCFLVPTISGAKDKDKDDEKPKKEKKHKSAIPPYGDEPWVCMKNGHIIEVKGKGKRDKQDKCEAQFGIWEKKRHAEEETGHTTGHHSRKKPK